MIITITLFACSFSPRYPRLAVSPAARPASPEQGDRHDAYRCSQRLPCCWSSCSCPTFFFSSTP